MLEPFRPTTFFWYGTLAVIASWVMGGLLTGCRFGNHVQQGLPPYSIDYYGLTPKTLKYCDNLGPCLVINTNVADQVPSLISEYLTDPVQLIRITDSTEVYFRSNDGKSGLLDTSVDATGNILLTLIGDPALMWDSSSCLWQRHFEQDGKVNPAAPTSVTLATGTVTLQGRIDLSFKVTDTFGSACDTPIGNTQMQKVYQCYLASTPYADCLGDDIKTRESLHHFYHQLFDQYVDAGAFQASDIPNLTSMSYEVSYQ